jgi:RNA polymerase sigma factor (sigma-70 family)
MHIEGSAVLPAVRRQDRRVPGEADMIARAKAGDLGALEPLYRAYVPTLLRYALSWTNSHADAEDAVSEAWLTAMTELDRYEDRPAGGGFAAWVWSITSRRHLRETFRQQHRELRILDQELGDTGRAGRFGDLFDDSGMWASHDEPSAVQDDEDANRLDRVSAAMAALTERQCQVLAMQLDGVPTRDIAARLGMHYTAAVQRSQAAVEALRGLVVQGRHPAVRPLVGAVQFRLDEARRCNAAFDAVIVGLAQTGVTRLRVRDLVGRVPGKTHRWLRCQIRRVIVQSPIPGVRMSELARGIYGLATTSGDQVAGLAVAA